MGERPRLWANFDQSKCLRHYAMAEAFLHLPCKNNLDWEAGVMLFGEVTSDDDQVAPSIFVQAGVKVNALVCREVAKKKRRPWVYASYTT